MCGAILKITEAIMATDLIPFSFDAREIRLIDRSGEIWFVATDVAAVLEYRDAFMERYYSLIFIHHQMSKHS